MTSTQELRDAVDSYLNGNVNGYPHINDWDVSEITDFSELFSADRNPLAADFNESLNKWDTRNARSMMRLFYKAKNFRKTIGRWNVAKVQSFYECFREAALFDEDLSSWNTGSATDMAGMVSACIFLVHLADFTKGTLPRRLIACHDFLSF